MYDLKPVSRTKMVLMAVANVVTFLILAAFIVAILIL